MTNEELNTALYQKMFAKQSNFTAWLKAPIRQEHARGKSRTAFARCSLTSALRNRRKR